MPQLELRVRPGQKPNEAIEAIRRFGFTVETAGKGGHRQIYYESEPVRWGGRILTLPVHGSKSPISRGVAAQLTNGLRSYLQSKELH